MRLLFNAAVVICFLFGVIALTIGSKNLKWAEKKPWSLAYGRQRRKMKGELSTFMDKNDLSKFMERIDIIVGKERERFEKRIFIDKLGRTMRSLRPSE